MSTKEELLEKIKSVFSEEEIALLTNSEAPKKKRGRPKKNPEAAAPVKKKRGRPPKKKPTPEPVVELQPENDFSTNRQPTRSQVKAGKNKFVDEGELRDENDAKIVMRKGARSRPATKMVDVNCSSCGRTVQVSSSLIRTSYYRCERCCGA